MPDMTPGFEFLRACLATDDAEIQRVQEATDPNELLSAVSSIALAWGDRSIRGRRVRSQTSRA